MTFGAPLLLLGLLSVAAPIAVHLVHRRRAHRVPFPALALLRQSERRLAPHTRIKQLLLLASRVLFFVALPLAMARPACEGRQGPSTPTGRLPASVVIVIDDSASMSAPAGRGDVYARAVAEAVRTLSDLRPRDRAAIVTATDPPVSLLGPPVDDHGALRRALEAHVPSHGASDLPDALAIAADLHAGTAMSAHRTIILSDLTRSAWSAVLDGPLPSPLGAVSRRDLGAPSDRNVAPVAVRIEPAPSGDPDAWRIEATIAIQGDIDGPLDATLHIDGAAVGTQRFDARDAESAVVSFTHTLTAGGPYLVEVKVSGDTGATADDTRGVLLHTRRAARVLAIDGDARALAINAETFFLTRALDVTSGQRRVAETTVMAPDRLAETDFEAFDVVVLANVSTLPAAEVDRIASFVSAGGGLLLAPGDAVEPSRWNADFGALLPKPLRSVRALSTPGAADANLHATRLAEVDGRHPVGRPFSASGGQSLRSALVHRYVLLEPDADANARTVASFSDGAPALVEKTMGHGAVLLWTSTLDADWNDLPLSTAWVPLVHRLIEVLGRRPGEESTAEVGRPHTIDAESHRAEQVLVRHAGDEIGPPAVLSPDSGVVRFTPARSGAYTVTVRSGDEETRAPLLDFVANVPASEVETVTADPDVVDERLAEASSGPGAAGDATEEGRPAWPLFLLLGLFALYAESALAARRRAWARIRGAFTRP
jgi:hypothetical protein